MSREVCGICWCPYDDITGECACLPANVQKSTLREAAQQALEALEIGYDSAQAEADQFHAAMAGYKPQRHAAMDADVQKIARAITALRAALAEPVQEPVAWMDIDSDGNRLSVRQWSEGNSDEVPLYTAPPQRKPLSEEEIEKAYRHIWRSLPDDFDHTTASWIEQGIRYAERAHGVT